MRLTPPITRNLGIAFALLQVSIALHPTPARAQAPVELTAKSANVVEAGTPIKVSILRWSTDQERKPIVDSLDPAAQAAAAQAAAAAGGRGGGRGGRGGRGGGLDPNDPALADVDAQPARGGRNARDAAPAKPPNPMAILTGALSKAPTVGYLWTNEVVGYSIKYAYRTPLRDGGERIILATDRRLGAGTAGWKPVATATPTDYEFTLIEIRMDSKGVGEGKTSLTSKVILENEARTLALDNYAASLAILQNVTR
jgi:hypothetical protein